MNYICISILQCLYSLFGVLFLLKLFLDASFLKTLTAAWIHYTYICIVYLLVLHLFRSMMFKAWGQFFCQIIAEMLIYFGSKQ